MNRQPDRFRDFVCPACGGDLSAQDSQLACNACGNRYPVLLDVPLLLPGIAVATGPAPDDGFVTDLAHAALPGNEKSIAPTLRELFSTQITFPDAHLGTEGHRFVHRLRASGHMIREPDGSEPAASLITPLVVPAPTTSALPRVSLELLTAPPTILAEHGFGIQIRVTNLGDVTLTSDSTAPFHISYFAKPPKQPGFCEGSRTALLVDIPPGGSLTLPVSIAPPDRPGTWIYQITPVIEDVAWLHDSAIAVKIKVLPATAADPLKVDWPAGDTIRDYAADHERGMRFLSGWLRARLKDHPAPRILELGGNAAPQIAFPAFALPGATRYNLDIDPFGLAFGTAQRRFGGGEPVIDLLGDGTRLPFADRTLDAIVMFATLHHFPNPVALLQHLRSKLAPGGLICVLCEPMGQVTRDSLPSDFRDELLGGICEQAFLAWEYRQFFRGAGLKIAHAMIDIGSLKVALEATNETYRAIRAPLVPIRPVFPAHDGVISRFWEIVKSWMRREQR